MPEVKIGALCWNQYTDWQSLQEAGIRADRLGYDPSSRPTDLTWQAADPSALAIARSQVSRLPDSRADLAGFDDARFLTKLGVADSAGTLNVAGQLMFARGSEDLVTYQYRPTPGALRSRWSDSRGPRSWPSPGYSS